MTILPLSLARYEKGQMFSERLDATAHNRADCFHAQGAPSEDYYGDRIIAELAVKLPGYRQMTEEQLFTSKVGTKIAFAQRRIRFMKEFLDHVKFTLHHAKWNTTVQARLKTFDQVFAYTNFVFYLMVKAGVFIVDGNHFHDRLWVLAENKDVPQPTKDMALQGLVRPAWRSRRARVSASSSLSSLSAIASVRASACCNRCSVARECSC